MDGRGGRPVRILLLNHYAGSPHHGMEYRSYYLAREWVRCGHEVTIVAASVSHLRTRAPQVEGKLSVESIEGVRYVWLRTPPYQSSGAQRALNMLSFTRQLYHPSRWLPTDWRPDAVIAASTYVLDNLPAHRLARRFGATFIYEVRDLWPLSPVEVGGMSRRHPLIVLVQWAEDYAYRHVDAVACALPCAEPYMRTHGLPSGKFHYLPNGIDASGWQAAPAPLPPEHASALRELREKGHFLVGYAGGHAISNALESFVDAAEHLRGAPVSLVLVGQGEEKDALCRRAAGKGLENVIMLPPVAKAAVPALLSQMDTLFLGWQRKPIYRYGVSPNKLMDYMMAAKPIIHAVEAANDVVAESACGLSIPPEEPAAIAAAVLRLAALPAADRIAMGQRGREYVLANHDYRVLASRFLEILR